MEHLKGTVKWFHGGKGDGFITTPEVKGDVLVHHTSIKMEGYKNLLPGQSVEFDLEITDKGLLAKNVTPSMEKVVRTCPQCSHTWDDAAPNQEKSE